jgi:hypothetical protein
MVYRKSPPRPPRLLLRVVAAAGAGALLGAAACSSSDSLHGSVFSPPEDSGTDQEVDDSSVTPGLINTYPEGGDAERAGGGIMVTPDAEPDVHISGIAPPMPDGGTD